MAQTRNQWLTAGLLCACLCTPVFADWRFGSDDPEAPAWKEGDYQLPAFPKDEDLIEFYVSATTTAKYFVDQKSITIGKEDGVVRYTMVIKTSGGATNINFEGQHCNKSMLKRYATGRADGTWVKNPNADWVLMRRISADMHQAMLNRYFFCPNYVPIETPAEGIDALRRGVHPDAPGEER